MAGSASSFLKAETPEHREAMNKLREEVGLPSRREIWRMSQEEREALQPKFEEFNKLRVEVEKKYPPTDLQDFVDHIDHAVKIAGIDHVGIGTDFDGGGALSDCYDSSELWRITQYFSTRLYKYLIYSL